MVCGIFLLLLGSISVIFHAIDGSYMHLNGGEFYEVVMIMVLGAYQFALIVGGITCIINAKKKKQSCSDKEENQ